MENTTEHQFPNPNIKGLTRSVLVTGGGGYVGSHTCKLLSKNGYVPVTVDRHYREGLVSFGPNYNLQLPQEIKSLGKFKVKVNLHSEVQAEFNVEVVAEEAIR